MRVHDIMSRPVYTVRVDDKIEIAAALLASHNITAAPVLDDDGGLAGIVSESDLLWNRVPGEHTVLAGRGAPAPDAERPEQVSEVMTDTVITSWPGEDVSDVAAKMVQFDVRSLPVLDGDDLVGIVSRRDILRAMVRTDDVVCAEVQHRLDEYTGGPRRWTVSVAGGVATVDGSFDDETERQIVAVMTRTVPGVAGVAFALPAA